MDADNTDDKPQVMLKFTASIGDIRVSHEMPMRKCHAFAMPRIVGELLEKLTEKCTRKAELITQAAIQKGKQK